MQDLNVTSHAIDVTSTIVRNGVLASAEPELETEHSDDILSSAAVRSAEYSTIAREGSFGAVDGANVKPHVETTKASLPTVLAPDAIGGSE
jgi:hypothetical protein